MSESLPLVLQRLGVKNAVDLFHKGDFPGVNDGDFFVGTNQELHWRD